MNQLVIAFFLLLLCSCSETHLLSEKDISENGLERISQVKGKAPDWKSYIHWYCFPSAKLKVETYSSEEKEIPYIKVHFHHMSFAISTYTDISMNSEALKKEWNKVIDYEKNGETCFYMTQVYSESAAREYSFDFYVEKIKSKKGTWTFNED